MSGIYGNRIAFESFFAYVFAGGGAAETDIISSD